MSDSSRDEPAKPNRRSAGDADAKRFQSLGDFGTFVPASDNRPQSAPDDLDSRAHENTWSLGGTTTVPGGPSPGDASGLDEGFAEQDDLTQDLDEHYEILKHVGKDGKIGEGGMGEVYAARHRRLQDLVAIKFVQEKFIGDRAACERFLREARVTRQLKHQNIVQVLDVARNKDGRLYLAMEFVGKIDPKTNECMQQDLDARLRREGPLTASKASELIVRVCDGLALAHKQNPKIIHRDIKPANILLTDEGTPKLADFGLARRDFGDLSLSRAGAAIGTPAFMSPEQHAGRPLDERSDLYSLAVTLYVLVTGSSPHVLRLDAIEEPLRDILDKALQPNPKDRYQSAAEFGQALAPIAAAIPVDLALLPGQCLACGRKNSLDRKICSQCGAKLLEPCLRCNTQNPVWEKFCNDINCGSELPKLISERKAQIAADKLDVESLRAGYRFGEAIERLQKIAGVEHPRFTEEAAWAKTRLQKMLADLGDEEARRNRFLEAARERFTSYDDDEAINFLEGIPEPLRDHHVESLLEKARERRTAAENVQKEVRAALKSKNYEGLEPKLKFLLELRPNNARAAKLLDDLRRSKEKQESYWLAKDIKVAQANRQYDGLRPKLDRYLELNPGNAAAQRLLVRVTSYELEQLQKLKEQEVLRKRQEQEAREAQEKIRRQQDEEARKKIAASPIFETPRGSYKPHRGTQLVTFSILGWMCFPVGIYTIVAANSDLKEMNAGRMDPAGRQQTKIAKRIAITYFALLGVSFVVTVINAIMSM